MPDSRGSILIADDDFVVRKLLIHNFERVGLHPAVFEDGHRLLAAADEDTLVAVVDLKMPGPSGIDCLKSLKTRFPKTEVIVLTAVNQASEAIEALRQGAFDYITKPFEPEEVILSVRKAMEISRTARENVEIRQTLESPAPVDFLGDSAPIQRIRQILGKVAPSPSTVLITGENGTGKGVLARAIHAASPRAAHPFITVSCPSLPKDLLESELFGHEKGAFSGAVQKRLGRVELANGGTLFLDEIGEMPLDLQPKLLNFLQERAFFRIGGQRLLEADVRLIAATNRNLREMAESGSFREDLYFRLNVLPLEMPPLRQRGDDVLKLAEFFISRNATRAGVARPKLTDNARERLVAYDWPGNVRQLENALERAFTLRLRDDAVDAGDLPPEIQTGPSPRNGTHKNGTIVASGSIAGVSLEELEKRAIRETLALCNGNKAETARILGITEKSIYNKMKRLALR